jgi:hypothetical protein
VPRKITSGTAEKGELDKLITKSVFWGVKFAVSVMSVGGDPTAVLRHFSDESIVTMVSNGLVVKDHSE